MKFLIAASFLCLALVGQIQGGSLRGLVRMPHQVYGPPLLEGEIHIDETASIPEEQETTIITAPIPVPSPEYGAPAVVAEVERIPFEHSLPHVDSHVNFGTPAPAYLPPATPAPELPHLEPGLPTLPEAPFVPVEVTIPEVHNTYLPPAKELPEVYLPPTPSNEYLPPATPAPELPYLQPGLPTLPEAPFVPVEVSIPEVHNTYLPPVKELPEVYLLPTPTNEYLPPATPAPELPYLQPGLPSLPEAPVTPETPTVPEPVPEVHNTYLPPVKEVVTTPAPVVETPHTPSEVYGAPPVHSVPEYPEIVELPEFPEIPTPVEEEKPGGYHYTPPKVPFDLPKVTIHAPVLVKEVKPHVHVASHFIDIPVKHEQILVHPVAPVIEHYNVPTKDIHTFPNLHGLVGHSEFVQNHASSALSSSHQVNKYVVPGHVQFQPTITHDTVLVEELKPAYSFESIHSGSKKTSSGSFSQKVSVVGHDLPSFSTQW